MDKITRKIYLGGRNARGTFQEYEVLPNGMLGKQVDTQPVNSESDAEAEARIARIVASMRGGKR